MSEPSEGAVERARAIIEQVRLACASPSADRFINWESAARVVARALDAATVPVSTKRDTQEDAALAHRIRMIRKLSTDYTPLRSSDTQASPPAPPAEVEAALQAWRRRVRAQTYGVTDDDVADLLATVTALVAAERERCARVADDNAGSPLLNVGHAIRQAPRP